MNYSKLSNKNLENKINQGKIKKLLGLKSKVKLKLSRKTYLIQSKINSFIM